MRTKQSFIALMANRLSPWRRHLDNARGDKGSATGAIIAVAGVACAVTVMILTICIAQGFNNAIKHKLSGFEPAISVAAPYSYTSGTTDEFIQHSPELKAVIDKFVPNAKQSLTLRQPSIIKTDNNFEAIIICGFDANHSNSFEKSNIIDGYFPDFSDKKNDSLIVVSQTTANKLELKTGERITLCFFIKDRIKSRRMTIAGIYNSGFGDYDATIAYASLLALQKINGVDSSTGTSVDIFSPDMDPMIADTLSKQIQSSLVSKAQQQGKTKVEIVSNISQNGAVYLNWLDLIDTNVVVIFILMCCVSCLTLVSSLFIIILDNISTIGLLRSLGASAGLIRSIFIRITLKLVLSGIIIGNILSLGFGILQTHFHLIKLDPEMYYLDTMPFDINFNVIILINAGVFILSWCVLMIPARLASSISPAKTMNFE